MTEAEQMTRLWTASLAILFLASACEIPIANKPVTITSIPTNPIVGVWRASTIGTSELQINADGTMARRNYANGVVDTLSGNWSSASATLKFSYSDGSTTDLVFSISSDSSNMTVASNTGGLSYVMIRGLDIPAKSVSISYNSSSNPIDKATMLVGYAGRLYPLVTPYGATAEVKWSSSDPGIVSVGTDGKFSAISSGTAIITGVIGAVSDVITIRSGTVSGVASFGSIQQSFDSATGAWGDANIPFSITNIGTLPIISTYFSYRYTEADGESMETTNTGGLRDGDFNGLKFPIEAGDSFNSTYVIKGYYFRSKISSIEILRQDFSFAP